MIGRIGFVTVREVIIISIAMLKGHCCREASHCAVHLSSVGRLLFGSLHLSEVYRRASGHLHLGEAHRGSGCLHRLERTYVKLPFPGSSAAPLPRRDCNLGVYLLAKRTGTRATHATGHYRRTAVVLVPCLLEP